MYVLKMKSSFRDSSSLSADNNADRRTVIVERLNGSFGFTLQSYGIHYRDHTDVEVITYVDFVDPNGNAHKAGLKSGDVILSINGQEVDKGMDHATMVALIQSCPDRIRMVVVFENCVRKVELHMKYIRLHQLLEAKVRDYQEVCASEKSFVSRLNKARGITVPGSYHTIQPSQLVLRRNQSIDNPTSTSSSATSTTSSNPVIYSSKSMPRHYVQNRPVYQPEPLPMKNYGASAEAANSSCKRRSYLCIGKPANCTCCFTSDDQSCSPNPSISRTNTPSKQRPRSCHIPSCYNPSASPSKDDERYLIQPGKSCDLRGVVNKANVYGGYGFGYDCSSNSYMVPLQHPGRSTVSGKFPADSLGSNRQWIQYGNQAAAPNKSTEDLLLSSQFQSQCHLSSSPRHHQQANLESIAFYTRPSLPGASVGRSDPRYRQVQQQNPPTVKANPGTNDEGGFDQMRPYRTLPASSFRP